MARSIWKGSIPLGGMVTLQVAAYKATEKYAGDESLRQVCGCPSPEPFLREERCPHGQPRLTEAGLKSGASGTKVQMAAQRPDGSYAPIPDAELQAINAAVNSNEIEPLALLDDGAWPSHTVNDLWYLAPNDKIQGSLDAVAVFYAYLAESRKVLIGRWSTRGRQAIVAICAADGVLCMNRLRYAQEVREPEEAMKAPARKQVDQQMVGLMDTLLSERLTAGFNMAEVQDEAVSKKAAAVQKALAGELPAVGTTVTAEAPSAVPDLMAALKAAASEGKPAAKKPAKAKAKAAA